MLSSSSKKRTAVTVLVTLGLAVMCIAGYATQAPELETVLSRASEYVQSYERALGMVIAREEYVQRAPITVVSSDSPPILGVAPSSFRSGFNFQYQERRLLSDYMMVHLPSEGDQWMGFRAVIEVDGSPVRDRLERLQEILEGPVEAAVGRWRRLSEESARYNIGNVIRSTNVPTFALLVLRDEHLGRFEFERIGKDRVEGLDVWVISYRERGTPTLITDLHGGDVLTHGRLWIDPVDGRLVRTEVRTGGEDSELRSVVTVRYQPNAELGIWVPRDMKERYDSGGGQIEATAKYSNFQQFKVSVDTSLPK